jgi:hypothetical protein
MDDQTQNTNFQSEIDELIAKLKKDRQKLSVTSKVHIAKANQLADELEKVNLSDLEDAEKKAMKDLSAVVAEEVASLEMEEAEDSKEETSE